MTFQRTLSVVCDGCGRQHHAHESDGDLLPPGWIEIRVPRWIGVFHACSEPCGHQIRQLADQPSGEKRNPVDD